MKSVRILIAATVWLLLAATINAQCLHDSSETPYEKERRMNAAAMMRTLNTAQIQFFVRNQRYGTLQDLATLNFFKANVRTAIQTGADLVPGFDLHLTADAKTWSISLIDRIDPCTFIVFTNDTGIIFTGYPFDFVVTPSKPAGLKRF